ncbi:hypothetical protein ACFLS1_05405 [Verrucomicrobiota bacterium]
MNRLQCCFFAVVLIVGLLLNANVFSEEGKVYGVYCIYHGNQPPGHNCTPPPASSSSSSSSSRSYSSGPSAAQIEAERRLAAERARLERERQEKLRRKRLAESLDDFWKHSRMEMEESLGGIFDIPEADDGAVRIGSGKVSSELLQQGAIRAKETDAHNTKVSSGPWTGLQIETSQTEETDGVFMQIARHQTEKLWNNVKGDILSSLFGNNAERQEEFMQNVTAWSSEHLTTVLSRETVESATYSSDGGMQERRIEQILQKTPYRPDHLADEDKQTLKKILAEKKVNWGQVKMILSGKSQKEE